MTEYTIVYVLDDEQQRELEAVTELHNQCKGAVQATPAQLFRAIFSTGTHAQVTERLQATRQSFEAIIAKQATEARDAQEAAQAAEAQQ